MAIQRFLPKRDWRHCPWRINRSMIGFIIVFAILFLLPLCFYFAIQGRTRHPKLSQLQHRSYAHRGLHKAGIPENSMAAFAAAKAAGYGVELDVHLTKDGELVVIHDSTLERVTGEIGIVEERTLEQLRRCRLEGTNETIPEFNQVLTLFDGKVPLIVELKPYKGNHKRLAQAACALMDHYQGAFCMESFDPRCLIWLKKHRPDIVRGQLTENYFEKGRPKMPWILRWILTHNLENFLTKPDFIAYRFTDRCRTITNRLCMKRMVGVSWTITNQKDFDQAVAEGWIPIFEGFLPKRDIL